MKITFASLILTFFIVHLHASNETRLMRFPTIHENKLVFSHGGDLYIAPSSGGLARKLTSHVGYEMFPRFSPDGKHIAFTGQYDGNTEVYIIPSTGGVPKRLTHTATLQRDDISDRMGPNNIVMGWHPDGNSIIYRSRKRSFNPFKGQLYRVSIEGGLSESLPLAGGGFCSFSPDGLKLAFNSVFREFRTWKYYQGGMADDVRIFDLETKEVKRITNTPNQDIIPMWAGDEIYFVSDRDRTMNLFVYNTRTEETEKVTHFTEYDIKFPSIGSEVIVFENGGYIYKFDTRAKQLEKVEIHIADDFIHARDEIKDASKQIRNTDISPNGERVLFSARGEIFSVPSSKGFTRNLTLTPGVHERNATWAPDGQYIAYISDISGEFEIYIMEHDGSGQPVQLTTNADTYKYTIKWSPDSKKILWNDRKLRLQYVDINTKEVFSIARSTHNIIHHFNWSPDSKWITFSEMGANDMNVVKLYNLNTKTTHEVTDAWFTSSSPTFSSGGKYLIFSSRRDFNPVYSQTEWNHAYNNMEKVYMVTLAKDTPSPFIHENDVVKIEKAEGSAKQSKKSNDDDDALKEIEVKIDIDGIKDRVISLPVKPSNYSNITGVANGIYYIENPASGDPVFKYFDLNKKEETEIGNKMNYRISAANNKMIVREGDRYAVIDLPKSKISLDETVDLSDMKVKTDYSQEWQQIYDESWRQMRDFFYAENMHGLDWQKKYEKYNEFVPYVKHRDDLTYIIGELIGELSAGHAYVTSGEKPTAERIQTGLLGVQLSRHQSGYFRIDKILEGATWSESLRSPLKEIGMNINEGDYIIAIDGIPVNTYNNVYELLIGKAGRKVEISINTSPTANGARKEIVMPVSDESNLYYHNWVQHNIRRVHAATNGQVGYIHIPDMGVSGLNEFAKYYYPQLDKKALIIDDRGNGGGNVSPMIIERLKREIIRMQMVRNLEYPRTVPRQVMPGPKVMLIDKYSASDGDLFAYAFKKHGLGKLIGERTWGGVVGITSPLPFIDGMDLRRPEFATYSDETGDWIIEGYGVDPDIWVENDPYKEFLGEDAQLEKAIEVILKQLENYEELPPIPELPDKSR